MAAVIDAADAAANKKFKDLIESISRINSASASASSSLPGLNRQIYQLPDGMTKAGTVGDRTNLISNYLTLTVQTESKKLDLHEYVIKFEPPLEGIQTQKLFLMEQFSNVIGKNWIFKSSPKQKLFLDFKLDEPKLTLIGKHPRMPEVEHQLILEFVDKAQDSQQVTQFCDALFIRLYEILGLTELNQKLYDTHALFHDPEKRLEIWPGLLAFARFYDAGLMLGFETTIRAMKMTNCYDVFQILSQTDDVKEKFSNYAIGKIFMTKFDSRMYKIADIDWDQTPLSETTVYGKNITYVDYYRINYGVRIKHMDQPLFVTVTKVKSQEASQEPSYVVERRIPELCYPMRLVESKKDYKGIIPYMESCCRGPPMKKVDLIQTYANKLKRNEKCVSLLKVWKLELGDFVKAEGRILDNATLEFGGGLQESTLQNKFGHPSYHSIPLARWLVFCSYLDFNKVSFMLRIYPTVSKNMGIEINPPIDVVKIGSEISHPTISDFYEAVKNNVNKSSKIQLVMIVVPSTLHQTDFYSSLKKLCLLELGGVPSQMIKASSLVDKKKLPEVVESICVQINCKLGGSPWGLRIPTEEEIMFVGIDTYHSPKGNPSVFAMIISLNSGCTKYYSRASIQKSHQETGDNIFPMFSKGLAAYHDETHKWPDRIIVFRDGINNKNMELVKEYELGQMRKATSFLHPHNPKFIFIIVQKRIIERLYTAPDTDLYGNPIVGTVLDDTLTRMNYFDFFLISQLKFHGTVTPVHYVVIANDDDWPPDLIQKFAHVSCFMYFNYPGPIRVPGVCQYAHRLASLIGSHLKQEPFLDAIQKQLYYL